MKYDLSQIDNSNPQQPLYKLEIDIYASQFDRFETKDKRSVVANLQQSLPFLLDDRMTFDAETLLSSAWRTDIGSTHNRMLGAFLRRLIDLELVPLTRVPKGRGTRIRFRIQH